MARQSATQDRFDVMIADPWTKSMDACKLTEALDSNTWDTTKPIEAIAKKRAKQLARRKTRVDAEQWTAVTSDPVAEFVYDDSEQNHAEVSDDDSVWTIL